MSSSNPSPPQFPKKARIKFQASKDSCDARVTKKKYCKSQIAIALCHKVKYLLPEDSLQLYQEKFLNKLIDPECHVDASPEIKLRSKFLKPFSNHNLLKFLGPNKKYNSDYVKVLYYNIVQTRGGI